MSARPTSHYHASLLFPGYVVEADGDREAYLAEIVWNGADEWRVDERTTGYESMLLTPGAIRYLP